MDVANTSSSCGNQFIPRKNLRFEVHLTDHCNLDCFGCYHFSPLATEWFLSIESYREDCQRLSELSNGIIDRICLMGGEPLLHPEISNICTITRDAFPVGNIHILTNGLLLNKMDESFWKALNVNNVVVVITCYPVNLDYNLIKNISESLGVHVECRGNANDRTQTKIPLDLNGEQNIEDTFYRCHRPNNCIQLRDGKLWTCVIPPYIKYFNVFFEKNLVVSENDSINIYKVNSVEEIYKFLVKPIPFCRYCKNKEIVSGIKWCKSTKEIDEWL